MVKLTKNKKKYEKKNERERNTNKYLSSLRLKRFTNK